MIKKNPTKKLISITHYKVYENKGRLSSIIFLPKTGKTHQIRIVAKHLGCPIVGDTKYNVQNKYKYEKLKLNACRLEFSFDTYNYEFTSVLPDHFKLFFTKNNFKNFNANNLKNFL